MPKSINISTEIATKGFLGAIIPLMIVGFFYLIMNAIDIFQMIYYLYYINVFYTPNLKTFFDASVK